MKNLCSILFFAILFSINVKAQEGAPSKCSCISDSIDLKKINVAVALRLFDAAPIMVKCDNNKVYKLNAFEFTYLSLKPFEAKTFGIGDSRGIPLMGRRQLVKSKPTDTIIFKEVIGLDDKGVETKLPNVSVKLEE
jgi:hypothetical protein